MRRLSDSLRGVAAAIACAALIVFTWDRALGDEGGAKPATAARDLAGRELFTREWIPGDTRSHGGDGLGPLFNESSCVACHNQGGVGGGGPAGKNAQIITAFRNIQVQSAGVQRPHARVHIEEPRTLPQQVFRSIFGELDEPVRPRRTPAAVSPPGHDSSGDGAFAPPTRVVSSGKTPSPAVSKEQQEKDRQELAKLHPGLQFSPSVVLHRNATYAEYDPWRRQIAGFGHFGGNTSSNSVEFFANARVPGAVPDKPKTSVPAADDVPVTRSFSVPVTRSTPAMPVHRWQQVMQQVRQEAQVAAQRRQFNQATQHGNFAIVRSERNTTALFGDGLIDSISDAVLEELEKEQSKSGQVSGRVSRLKDGKIGRFGWKGQTATLEDFVLTACAVELGLNVPGHPQAGVPHKPDYRPAGLDLNAEECRLLVDFIRDLPAPQQRPAADETDAAYLEGGSKLFHQVGCAACHVPNVGKVAGIYSDLLLHDLGPDLGDSGSSYGIFVPDSTPEEEPAPRTILADSRTATGQQSQKIIGATRQEWRTPPLWGVRDSAPYLHDGRAETLEQAIAFHGGEAQGSTQRFFELSPAERFQLITFLKSLVAPETSTVAAR